MGVRSYKEQKARSTRNYNQAAISGLKRPFPFDIFWAPIRTTCPDFGGADRLI